MSTAAVAEFSEHLKNKNMRRIVESLRTHEVAHLICEARQWVLADLPLSTRDTFIRGLSSEHLQAVGAGSQWESAKLRLWAKS